MYRYRISKQCFDKIYSFYQNVSKKYMHTYSIELMHKNIDDAVNSMYQIERSLIRRNPTIPQWKGYFMANSSKWYFAYLIDGDTIVIVDACHVQNMK